MGQFDSFQNFLNENREKLKKSLPASIQILKAVRTCNFKAVGVF
jgi:hypothetical protein